MKIDKIKVKKCSSELTPECRLLIDQISKCKSRLDILNFLKEVKVWVYGKCELYHWMEILDRFDSILEESAKYIDGNEFILQCDVGASYKEIDLLLSVLHFTTLLIEHSFSRHLYNSVEHLTVLLSSENMDIVLAVLNLLYMFSKRSNFIPRLTPDKKEVLLLKLYCIAERWGDPNYGLSLIDCCLKNPRSEFLHQFFVEYIDESGQRVTLEIPNMKVIYSHYSLADTVKILCQGIPNPPLQVKMRIAHRVRLVSGFENTKHRLQFVQARLQAISVLIYSNALQDNLDGILYQGFGEELCELIDKRDEHLIEIRAAILRTLTSMLHFDRNPNIPRPGSRLSKIIYYTGAERHAGTLSLLVRDCISNLVGDSENEKKYPIVLATSLFSLLYHLASYEAGGLALIKSGMMESLLKVINWTALDLEHITFVTRAVRVIDLITNIDIAKFHQNNGINVFIERLEKEISICCETISNLNLEEKPSMDSGREITNMEDISHDESDTVSMLTQNKKKCAENDILTYPLNSYYSIPIQERCSPVKELKSTNPVCVTQRAALLKSILNFVKKSIQDHANTNGSRNIMETSLPNSLRHIILNADFYGPSLFLLATDVITVFVFNEPSLLYYLQDSGLTNVMLKSLLDKDVPATREVLGSLPNVFSALCLNERGLLEFMSYDPFDKILKVFLSPDYLVAMRRRRSSDPLGDTATNLGNAMDDFMKHHPYLRTDSIEAIVRLLNELVRLGTDQGFICWRANKDSNSSTKVRTTDKNSDTAETNINYNANNDGDGNDNDSSGDDDDDDGEISTASQHQQQQNQRHFSPNTATESTKIIDRESIPLIDYILNVMKFIEAIFSNSSSSDNCREFVMLGGLKPLLQLLSLPNLPVDSPVSTTSQAIANVAKCILNLSLETKIIDISLQHLSGIVEQLSPLITDFDFPCGSILFKELLCCPNISDGFSNANYTPLLHNMSAVHGYVVMLVHLCRNASTEMRSILLKRWGNEDVTGLGLLRHLVKLYISLVWESTILLSLCSDESFNQDMSFTWDEMISFLSAAEKGSTDVNDAKEPIQLQLKPEDQIRYTKNLLAASSRLGRTLAELFGTLVKLSVGTPETRPRRVNDFATNVSSSKFPSEDSKNVARVLSSILVNGFCHENILPKSATKLKLTFLICSVGFTGPMLFDDKRSAFHLMLSQFYEENGMKAFFEMFYWALSVGNISVNEQSYKNAFNTKNILENFPDDNSNFPEGSGEFLYAWLQLLEKMVNPRSILDSPYVINSVSYKNKIPFEPFSYLIKIHNLAIHAIRRIWKRKPISNYGPLMITSMMTVLKHITKSHGMLRDKYCHLLQIKETRKGKNVDTLEATNKTMSEGNSIIERAKFLTDMGFDKDQVLIALDSTQTFQQATDFLLNYTKDVPITKAPNNNSSTDSGEKTGIDIDVGTGPSTSKCLENPNNMDESEDNSIISEDMFNKFCEEISDMTFKFMEDVPDTTTLGAVLISSLHRRKTADEKSIHIDELVSYIKMLSEEVICVIVKSNSFESLEDVFSGKTASKLSIRLKVSTLLLEDTYIEFRKDFCKSILGTNCLNDLILLLLKTENILTQYRDENTKSKPPLWLDSLVEFLDLVDNIAQLIQHQANTKEIINDMWKWYDISTGKWNKYSEFNNAVIKNAYNLGERSVTINIGRQRNTINFNCMTQVSEPSGSHRTVMPSLKVVELFANARNEFLSSSIESIHTHTKRSKLDGGQFNMSFNLRTWLNVSSQIDKNFESSKTHWTNEDNILEYVLKGEEPSGDGNQNTSVNIIINEERVGLSKLDNAALIISLISLLKTQNLLHFDSKLIILKLCTRLTKDFKNAEIFYANGGLEVLLKMQQSCSIMIYPTYPIILMRHLLESPRFLEDAFECSIRSRTTPQTPPSHRDLGFLLSQFSSAAARSPNLFLETAKRLLQVDLPPNSKNFLNGSQFVVKICETKNEENSSNMHMAINVLKEILKAIVQPCIHYEDILNNSNFKNYEENNSILNDEKSIKINSKKYHKFEVCCSWHIPCSRIVHQKPVLSRSTLLKFLCDSIRSYQALVPRFLIDHVYHPIDSTLIKQEQSFLSFILDNFLPIVRPQQDGEVSMMTRVLIISLMECSNQYSVQLKVVEEIKEAILRSLAQPDSTEKHIRIQVLIGLFPAIVESPISLNVIQQQRNNILNILIKNNVITCLAKLAQYSNLSNPKSISTISSILRPMEILLKITASPGSKRLVFSTNPQGLSSSINRRLYSRISTSSHSTANEHVLRDIIRNVFTDRRQAFDIIFNDDTFVDASASPSSNTGDDDNDNMLDSFSGRSQISFDRLWDDLLQNDNLRIVTRTIQSSISESVDMSVSDQQILNDAAVEGENLIAVSGGSDGASTSSQIVNHTNTSQASDSGDVSTAESDTDSNVSTESGHHNEEERDVGERSSNTDGTIGEDSHQFMEIYPHDYEEESFDAALNDAVDDEGPDTLTLRTSQISNQTISADQNSLMAQGNETYESVSNEIYSPITTTGDEIVQPNANNEQISNDLGERNIDYIQSNVSADILNNRHANILMREENADTSNETSSRPHITSLNNIALHPNSSYRREPIRRLLFLDQQYCTQMPSFSNPTEEGQIEVFNQDVMHWWQEEAKYLEMEHHSHVCLKMAHYLIIHLLNKHMDELILKKADSLKTMDNITNQTNSIPTSPKSNIDEEEHNQGCINLEQNIENAQLVVPTEDDQNRVPINNDDNTTHYSEREMQDFLGEQSSNGTTLTDQDEINFISQSSNLSQRSTESSSLYNFSEQQAPEELSRPTDIDVSLNQPETLTHDTPVATISAESNFEAEASADMIVPEGVDPSFLAALPNEIREEVIQEHLRMQRIRQRNQQTSVQIEQDALLEVSPEFLAALPPNIQSEVLMQQRIEQQRQAAQHSNPEDPVDTEAFFQNLPETLRQTILTDMEDSQISSLPPDIAAEAQNLRRNWDSRNEAQFNINQRNSMGVHLPGRITSSLRNFSDEYRWNNGSSTNDNGIQEQNPQQSTIFHQHKTNENPLALLLMENEHNLLDPDSLSTLLLFLFIEDSKFNYTRLYRIIRNLCYHVPTREWIIAAVMAIIQSANNLKVPLNSFETTKPPNWLKLKVDTAFGFKSNVFFSNRSNYSSISINPQAALLIIKNCLDLLLVLSKHFPRCIVPTSSDQKAQSDGNFRRQNQSSSVSESFTTIGNRKSQSTDDVPSTSKETLPKKNSETACTITNYSTNDNDFWKVIFKIDEHNEKRLQNISHFPLCCQPPWEWKNKQIECLSFNNSPFAKLIELLPFRLISRSPHITETLLKLLALLSTELPDEEYKTVGQTPIPKSYQDEFNTQKLQDKNSEQFSYLNQKQKIYLNMFSHLRTIVEVFTRKCGTLDGLGNTSKLIANISQCSQVTNIILITYLKAAIFGLAEEVRLEIKSLLDEINEFNSLHCNQNSSQQNASKSPSKCPNLIKGVMRDRYNSEQIVISLQSNSRSACKLLLSAINKLLSPLSAQQYFLRTLNIFIQIHYIWDKHNNYFQTMPPLSEILCLENLWTTLSECLAALHESKDEYAVLVLQPSVEAFFLIHSSCSQKNKTIISKNENTQFTSPATTKSSNSGIREDLENNKSAKTGNSTTSDQQKFLLFAENHRTVLNQILRQSSVHLSEGPFAVLVDHTRILDFDVKRKYFHDELERLDEGVRREENTVSVRRVTVFEDSFRALYRLGPEEWKNRFYIVFEDEEGQDAGGLLREWYIIISKEIFNPMYALFCVSPGDRVTYMINPSSYANPNHLSYFKFVGRLIAKAIHDNKLLECYFTRSFYKHILGKQVKYTDMESQDYEFYQGLDYLMKHDVSSLGYELTFSTEMQEFGVTQIRDLIPNGREILVTEENKFEYIQQLCQLKMSGSIRQQLDAFLEGFYDIIPKDLISIFNEQELELLISGLPDIDIEDLKANAEYHKYSPKSIQIQWFWRALRSFDQADRAKFLQFVTGTSKVPLQGFASLEGMNGIQKFQIHRDDRSTERLPCAHTCFNQLDLPLYKSYDKLRCCLLKAIHECSEGFGFA